MPDIDRQLRDTLLIIHYGINRSVDKKNIETLLMRNYIVAKHGGGWMTTSAGRECVRKMK